MLAHPVQADLVPGMRRDLGLSQVDLEQVDAGQVHPQHLERVQRVPAQLQPGALAAPARLPVQELEPVLAVPVAEVGRGEDAGAFEREGAHVLDEDPPLDGRALDLGQRRQPVEVPQAADQVVAQCLPLAVAHRHSVLVLEQGRALRRFTVDAGARALPLRAHLPHGVLDQGGLAQRVALAQGQQRPLDRLVHEPPHPHLAGGELLQHVEAAHEGIGVGGPAAP